MSLLSSLRRILFPILIAGSLLSFWAGAAQAQKADSIVVGLPGDFEKSHFLVTDLNGDDKQEILIANRAGTLFLIDGASYQVVWSKNAGVFLPKYDRTTMDAGIAAADLDLDGTLDIVLAVGGVDPITSDGPGAVVVIDYVGAPDYFRVMPGWPRYAYDELGESSARPDGTPDGFVATPSLGDIDGDGNLEIILGGMDRRIHAWHHDGSYVTGFPLDWDRKNYRDTRSTAALADMDGDGVMEIVIGTNNYVYPACPNPYLFYALEGDSTFMPGFPVEIAQNIESSPAIGDIDGDGYPDIVFGTGDYSEHCGQPADGNLVHAIDRFGIPLPGWPVRTDDNMLNSPALGDLDHDGIPEVVIHNGKTLYAWHGDGSHVVVFPVSGSFVPRHQSPIIADIDGDGEQEILVSTGGVYAANGVRSDVLPYSWTTLVVSDQDDDGYLESIAVTTDRDGINDVPGINRQIEVIQHRGRADTEPPWPMFHRSIDRRGVMEFSATITGRVVNKSGAGVGGVAVKLNNSLTLVTDADGYYSAADLLPGKYTIKPSKSDYVFTPSYRTVAVPPDGINQDFVMAPPTYSATGRINQPNGLPVSGIKVHLSTGGAATTNAQGEFGFDDLAKGTYDLTLDVPDGLRIEPATYTYHLPGDGGAVFYLLPMPVVETLNTDGPTPIIFTDMQGLATSIIFPAADVESAEVSVTPELPSDIYGFLAAGHTFSIAPGGGLAGADAGSGVTSAFTVELHYSVADLQSVLAAEGLTLLWLSPTGWVDATTTCEAQAAVGHDYQTRTIQTTLCAWGTYSLVGPAHFLRLPVLMSAAP